MGFSIFPVLKGLNKIKKNSEINHFSSNLNKIKIFFLVFHWNFDTFWLSQDMKDKCIAIIQKQIMEKHHLMTSITKLRKVWNDFGES